ncbi:MAG: SDR family NAD(P)-dependent oxidoreductase [Caldilineaceae bacterium]|nr:SDR family NAD(P)-dependent oxidoreductase [Caldilineaceae bacterium]
MKTIIVTGSNTGIGKEAARILAADGHRVLMLSRDSDKSHRAANEIRAATGNDDVHLFPVDLAEKSSIRAVVDRLRAEFSAIDVLVNNAGVYRTKRGVSGDGIELTFAVNYLATFMLSELLLDRLRAAGAGRIVNVISALYTDGVIDFDNLMLEQGYKAGRAYANAKLATALYTVELAQRVEQDGVTVNALHPGVLATDVFRDYPDALMWAAKLFLEKPAAGGERIARLAVADDVAGVTGAYVYKEEVREFEIPAATRQKTEQLLQVSRTLAGL